MSHDVSNADERAFVKACWAFKHRERTTEPTASEFNLWWPVADVLARQVQAEFEGRKVSEAKKAAA
jgi:hypothetical protein